MDEFSVENIPIEFTNCKGKFIIGVDEAGRGPVLGTPQDLTRKLHLEGPLVYSIFVCPVENEHLLKGFGAAGKFKLCLIHPLY
jgi:hypothetical protein